MPKRRELQQEKICKVTKITAVKERADKWHTVKIRGAFGCAARRN